VITNEMIGVVLPVGESGGDYNLIISLVGGILAAVVGGYLAHFLKLPVMIGFILAGMAIGPYTPGPVTSVEHVQTLAEIGVAFLMFSLGTEFSINEIKHVGKPAVLGATIQTFLIIGLGIPLGMILGLSVSSGLFLGGMLAVCSSIVILKLLITRGEMESLHGRLAIGFSITQDLLMIILVVVLPTLGQGDNTGDLVAKIGISVLKAVLFLGVCYFIGTRLIPYLLNKVILAGVRELFLLVVISLALGMAIIAYVLEISFALGAFIAGVLVSSSDAAHDVLNEIIPFRDVFASLFFVSIGMLIDPMFLIGNIFSVLLLVGFVIIGKWAIAGSLFGILGQPSKVAVRGGLLVAQIGEFSFVLANIGVSSGAISENVQKLILASALPIIIINPLIVQFFPRIAGTSYALSQWAKGRFGRTQVQISGESSEVTELDQKPGIVSLEQWNTKSLQVNVGQAHKAKWPYKKHVVVCGYGRVGRELVDACMRRNFEVVVIEYDQRRVEAARKDGILVFYGDCTLPITLKQAEIEKAKVLAVTTPDMVVTEVTTKTARQLNSSLEIITRANSRQAADLLLAVGANEVVQPEFEAGLEFIRRTAKLYGVNGIELQSLINGRRHRYYGTGDNQNRH
jgi:monovalent cation:H+ antiporter-2, CPA2 family